jgi:hypothetical protein
LPVSTFAALLHVPLVLVRVKEISVEEWVNESKLLIVWLKLPKPSSCPEPPSA